jgi:hypothetical protein
MSRLRNLLLLVLLAVCAASFWLARQPAAERAASRLAHGPAPAPVVLERPERSVHLAVLNGTREPGLARRLSRDLAYLGCVVVAIDDAPHDSFATSLLVNRRLPAAQVQWLAAALAGVPVVQEWDPRAQEDAVLVLGADHQRLLRGLPAQP